MTCILDVAGYGLDVFEEVAKLSKERSVQYTLNVLGAVPILGTGIGLARIISHIAIALLITAKFFPNETPDNAPRFRGIKFVQGFAELVPIAGPAVFWVCRGTYLAVKRCRG